MEKVLIWLSGWQRSGECNERRRIIENWRKKMKEERVFWEAEKSKRQP